MTNVKLEAFEKANEQDVEDADEQTTSFPVTIGEAICAVMMEVHRLEKTHTNAFSNYDFTSVDDFKDHLRPLMAKNGLYVGVQQDVATLEKDDKGKEARARFDFTMILKHVNGEAEPGEIFTVRLPFTGAQTSGAARSYAVKEWLKSRFLASAGDMAEEADLLDAGKTGRLSKAEARKMHENLQQGLNDAIDTRDKDKLIEWGEQNKSSIYMLPQDWEVMLRNDMNVALKELKAQEELDQMSNEELDQLAMKNELGHPLEAG